jgi:hypothetical protein
LIGVLDPSHDLLVGAHVRAKAVDSGSNESLLDELHGIAASNSLELRLAEGLRINLDTTLGTTEGDISYSELEGHK